MSHPQEKKKRRKEEEKKKKRRKEKRKKKKKKKKIAALCNASDDNVRILAINLVADMASHVASYKEGKTSELPANYFDVVPSLSLQVFINAMKAKSEEVQVAALQGLY